MTSASTQGSTNITLAFDLSRNLDAAAQDVQSKIAAAQGQLPIGMPSPPSYQKVNPADQADPLSRPQFALAAALASRRVRRDLSRRAHFDDLAASPRCRSTARKNTPCGFRSIPWRWPRAASASTRSPMRSPMRTSICRPARSTARNKAFTVKANGQLTNAAAYESADRRLSQRRAGAPARHWSSARQRAEQQGRRLGPRYARRGARRPAPAGHQYGRSRQRRSARFSRPFAPNFPPPSI